MNTETPTAVAWELWAPSVSGGKHYRVLLFDRFVIIGWGSYVGTMQYKGTQHTTADWAKSFALSQTQQKEAKGYEMTVWPKSSGHGTGLWGSVLPEYVGHRGSSATLDEYFRTLLQDGVALAG